MAYYYDAATAELEHEFEAGDSSSDHRAERKAAIRE